MSGSDISADSSHPFRRKFRPLDDCLSSLDVDDLRNLDSPAPDQHRLANAGDLQRPGGDRQTAAKQQTKDKLEYVARSFKFSAMAMPLQYTVSCSPGLCEEYTTYAKTITRNLWGETALYAGRPYRYANMPRNAIVFICVISSNVYPIPSRPSPDNFQPPKA